MFFEQAREHAERDCEKNPKDTQAREERERREGGRALALLLNLAPHSLAIPLSPSLTRPSPGGAAPSWSWPTSARAARRTTRSTR